MHLTALSNVFITLVSLNLVSLVFASPVVPRAGTPAQRCSHTKRFYITTTITKGAVITTAPVDPSTTIDTTLPPASDTKYWKSCTTTVTKTRTKKVNPPKTTKYTLPSPSFPSTFAESNIDTETLTPTGDVPTASATPVLVGSSLYTNPLDAVKPQATNRIVFASENSDSSFLVSNVGIKARKDKPIVNLEEFLNFISSVSCAENAITITFSDAAAYGIASGKWKNPFSLVTSGSKYCGVDDGTRSYYSVASAALDAANKKVTLAVTSSGLNEASASWSATFGTYDKVEAATKKRNTGDELEEAAHLVANHYLALKSKRDFSDDTTIHLSPDVFRYIPPISVGPLIVDHQGSGLWGDIKLSGGISSNILVGALSSAYVAIDFTGVQAKLDLDFSVGAGTTYTYEKELASYSPVALEIPGILSVGPFIKLKAGIDFTSQKVMSLNNVGFTASLPDSSFKIDIIQKRTTSSGWGKPNISPLKPSFSFAGVDVSLAVYIAPVIALELKVLDLNPLNKSGMKTIGSAEVDLQFPKLKTTMTSEPHTCANENQNNLNFNFEIGMKAFGAAQFSDIWEGDYTFFEKYWPLGQTCVAF